MTVTLDASPTLSDFVDIVRDHETVELADDARAEMDKSRQVVDEIVMSDNRPVYGINTGFGDLFDISIDREDQKTLQQNVLSVNTTVGDELPEEDIRAAMVARASVFAAGLSGLRPVVVDRLLDCLNAGVHPVLGEGGNADDFGVSAGIGSLLVGEGKAYYQGNTLPAEEALAAAGIEPIDLKPGDGLPLMDGPSLMTGRLVLTVIDVMRLINAADVIGALTFSLVGEQPSAFSSRVIKARPHKGDSTSARIIRELLDLNTRTDSTIAQDPLSIRTMPQIHGSARENLEHARSVAMTELGGVGDNPIVFPDGTVASCGGFNGQHVSSTADSLSRSLVKLGHGSERRINLYIEGRGESPHFVTENPGVESGLGRAHYTAASLVEEAASLGPASDRNIIVSAGQEDLQSMGTISTAHLKATLKKINDVLAVELMTAMKAYEISEPDLPKGAENVLEDFLKRDYPKDLSSRIGWVSKQIQEGELGKVVKGTGIQIPDPFEQ